MQRASGFAPPGALLTDDYDRVIRCHEARENRPRVFDRLRMAPQTTRKPTSIETALKPVHSLPKRTDRLEGSRYDLDGALGWHPVDRRASDIAIDLGNHAEVFELLGADDRSTFNDASRLWEIGVNNPGDSGD